MTPSTPKRSVLVVVSDLHVGSPFAVAPERWTLPDGNEFQPNGLQRIIRSHWRDCWEQVGALRKGARLIVCFDGDMTEGMHHETTQVLTGRIDTQEEMAEAVIEEGLALAKWRNRGDVLRFVTGTPAHDGLDGGSAERIARRVTDWHGDGRVTQDVWRPRINGTLFDITHEPASGVGTREHTKGNTFAAWLKSHYTRQRDLGEPWPRYIIRAHYHEYIERAAYDTLSAEVIRGYILAPWKVKDGYVWRRNANALSRIGMVAFDVREDGATTPHVWLIPVRSRQEEIEEL